MNYKRSCHSDLIWKFVSVEESLLVKEHKSWEIKKKNDDLQRNLKWLPLKYCLLHSECNNFTFFEISNCAKSKSRTIYDDIEPEVTT